MNRGQWMAVAGGAAVGLGGVAVGIALSRLEGRAVARRWLSQYGMPLAGSARRFAASAVEQYQEQAPKAVNTYAPQAREALGALVAKAPQVAGAVLGARLAVNGANG